jgi:hypothetical protein
MIIYRSFFEAIKELSKEQQADVWNAVYELGLNNNEVQLSGISKTIFTLIKPQIEANIKKYLNGKRPKTKPKESKTEANNKQKESKSETNVNDNVNVNVNNNIYRSFAHLSLTEEEFEKLNKVFSQEEIDNILDNIENNTNNKKYKSLYLTARNWLNRNKPKEEIIPFEKLDRLTRDSILKGYLKHEHYLKYYGKHKH